MIRSSRLGAHTVVVLAKEPRPGRVKTRLTSLFTPEEAAELAAASLLDTLDAVRASRARRRILALDGQPGSWAAGFDVIPQPAGDLNTRLAAAMGTAMRAAPGAPVLLVGMDTPQVTPGLLDTAWDDADGVVGLSEDGGFWAIGLRTGSAEAAFNGVPMSTDRTGACQLGRLDQLGLAIQLLPPLRDVDLPADAEAVATEHPQLTFSRAHRKLVATRDRTDVGGLFDLLYRDGAATPTPPGRDEASVLPIERHRWNGQPDAVDRLVAERCEPPVIDLGCGPGRMVRLLENLGRPVLGVDVSAVAVARASASGSGALRRDIGGRLPAEGRWGTALLLDGNLGIGGDVVALLRRCRDLVGSGGLVICEVHPDPDRDLTAEVAFGNYVANPGAALGTAPWSSVGSRVLASHASRSGLIIAEEWSAGGRAFVSLRSTP